MSALYKHITSSLCRSWTDPLKTCVEKKLGDTPISGCHFCWRRLCAHHQPLSVVLSTLKTCSARQAFPCQALHLPQFMLFHVLFTAVPGSEIEMADLEYLWYHQITLMLLCLSGVICVNLRNDKREWHPLCPVWLVKANCGIFTHLVFHLDSKQKHPTVFCSAIWHLHETGRV